MEFFENADGDCEKCRKGYVYVAKENKCKRCPLGMVSPGGMNTICRKCQPPLIANFVNAQCRCTRNTFFTGKTCKPCPAGTDLSDDEHRFRECFPCAVGTFKAKAGTHDCEPCPYPLVALQGGATKCTKCPAGTMPDIADGPGDRGALCVSTKTRCPPGYGRTLGADGGFFGCEKIRCAADTAAEDVGKVCARCEKGFRRRSEGAGCVKCKRNEVSEGGAVKKCKACPNGLFQDERDRSKCSCYGYFALGYGMQGGICKKCAGGTFAGYTSEVCEKCGAGTFARGIGNESCEICGLGTFSKGGASECSKCAKGRVPNRRRKATDCVREK